MPKLHVIIASTRPGRIGLPVARWFTDWAVKHGGFEVNVVDLAELNLPLMDEPNHPRLRRYEHQHTKDWSATADAADAFVIVMPEYNHGYTAPLKNALDYLNNEWAYKPVGLVSYGGVSGGLRAVQGIKPILTSLKMMPMLEALPIPFAMRLLNDQGEIQADEAMENTATLMLDELLRWTGALASLRGATTA
ncbi:NADPH-dependent FMN reductase [Streptosporangium sp. 'caverna']|uniref:NADPH-dependent FMN reductase n=1 Tax=Streptosporangium sp. 'caverna' TaxID=2202249 RepID=UPI000D7EAE71|nr:NAD(P)H-dependent oxidoreductase [Streptosporangium sp. 'caverna']AWS45520.1 NADPH-dependent FMN reductase [Streptosporangium sp. 'caverna']